jgi:hypothetical protein
VTLSLALTQASTASSDGTFGLTGNITYTNSSCSASGTISEAFLAGPYLILSANTTELDDSTGSFSYSPVLLNDPSTPKTMAGTYEVITGLCGGDMQTLTLTKQ